MLIRFHFDKFYLDTFEKYSLAGLIGFSSINMTYSSLLKGLTMDPQEAKLAFYLDEGMSGKVLRLYHPD